MKSEIHLSCIEKIKGKNPNLHDHEIVNNIEFKAKNKQLVQAHGFYMFGKKEDKHQTH